MKKRIWPTMPFNGLGIKTQIYVAGMEISIYRDTCTRELSTLGDVVVPSELCGYDHR